jgi:sugar lactone lactonase YvrE
MKIFADQLGFPEAPVLLPDGGFLFVEMDPAKGWVIRFSKDGKSRSVLAKTGRPNGLAPDRHGHFWVAETAMRALLRMSLDGKYEVIANGCGGEPFLFLNDVALAAQRRHLPDRLGYRDGGPRARRPAQSGLPQAEV